MDVTVTDSIVAALSALADAEFDIIVSDTLLFNESGIDFIKQYNESGGNKPILLVSGVKDMSMVSKYKEIPNFIGFEVKPITSEKVYKAYEKR
jgi:two-component SAPR family response regulator